MTLTISPVELRGERAWLVPMAEAHIDGLWDAAQSPEIWRYLPVLPQNRDDIARIVQAALTAQDAGLELPFVVIDRDTSRVVGSTRFLDISTVHRNLEIGWTWYAPAVWRTRINTECKYLLLRHCFETLGLLRVPLKTDLRNVRSQRAIERIGGVKEGVWRRHRICPDGYIRDTVYYSIIAEEWPGVKTRLEGFLESHAQRESA